MGIFGPRHRFKASPMSLAVPLEGTDTVVGLRELQRRKDGYDLARALKLDALNGRKPSRSWRRRYKGPFLSGLTVEDLQKQSKPWSKVAVGHGWHTYNFPESLDHLCERGEENLVVYLPNYIRLLLALILISLLLKPWSLLGVAGVAGLITLKLTATASPELRRMPLKQRFWAMLEQQYALANAALGGQQEQQAQPQQQQAQPQQQQQTLQGSTPELLQSMLQLLCYVLVIYCSTLGRVLKAVAWTTWIVAGHASLRRSPAEYREALQNPAIAAGKDPPTSCTPAVPGIAFVQVLGLRPCSSQDPHRVFREAWQLTATIGSAAVTYCWHGLQFYGHTLWTRVQARLTAYSR